ncbi:hypothetical protein EMIT0P228_60156 [Pseudomonas brassicacearum]
MGARLARDAGASFPLRPRRLHRGQALLPQMTRHRFHGSEDHFDNASLSTNPKMPLGKNRFPTVESSFNRRMIRSFDVTQ